jgi:hypothetical protein
LNTFRILLRLPISAEVIKKASSRSHQKSFIWVNQFAICP